MSVLHIYTVCKQNLVQSKMKEGGIATVLFTQIAGIFLGTAGTGDSRLSVMLDDSRAHAFFLLHDLPAFTVKRH